MFFRLSRYVLLLAAAFSTPSLFGQERDGRALTRVGFSRLGVLARAAYFERAMIIAARTEGMDPNILWTIAYNETRFRPWLTSSKGAKGLMQFIPMTAGRFQLSDPYDPTESISAAARYISYLSRIFDGRLDSILAAYNAGEGTVLSYCSGRPIKVGRKLINPEGRKTIGCVPPYSETIGYVARGLTVYRWVTASGRLPITRFAVKYPPIVSAEVATARSWDSEMGLLGVAAGTRASRSINSQPAPAAGPVRRNAGNGYEARGPEVYYDPRSGRRILLAAKDATTKPITRPLEIGPVIVTNETSRRGMAVRARSTLVVSIPRN